MITNKRISVIAAVIVAIVLLLTLLAMAFADELMALMGGDDGVSMSYEDKLFDTDQVITIDIEMDEEDWADMLENAISEEYVMCDMVINGTTFSSVGIRAKGNTSLSQVVSSDSDRYSFKVEFDQYVGDQTCWGLDKLVLNNCYADATMMKEYLTYDMFTYLGVDASLYNYAAIYVNGEYWGVYLALESVEQSFMIRNYGTGYGEAYKPDSLNFGGAGRMQGVGMTDMMDRMKEAWGTGWQDPTGTETDFEVTSPTDLPAGAQEVAEVFAPDQAVTQGNMSEASASDLPAQGDIRQATSTDQFGAQQGGGNMGGGSGSASAAELNYLDDDLDSYATIWDSSVFDSSDSDHERVVEALKNISESNDLEEYMDVDNLLRYMAVQTFVYNLDSLTGNMAHNYYLYEEGGQLNLIPWDYNLAFGGFQSGDASDVVNFPIDTPFTSSLDDREFFAALLEDEEYLAQYHEYLQTLVEEYVLGGELDAVYEKARSQIDDLVATDPTALYTYEEYDAAARMLYSLITLRGESVLGQLDGTIPSTSDGQEADSSALIDASSITLSVMGSMNSGGGNGGVANMGERSVTRASGTDFVGPGGSRASDTDFAGPGGSRASGTDFAGSGGGSTASGTDFAGPGGGSAASGTDFADPGGGSAASDTDFAGPGGGGQRPSDNGQGAGASAAFSVNMTAVYWLLVCLGVMLLALLTVKRFRRK